MKERRSLIVASAAAALAVAALVVGVLAATAFDDRGRAEAGAAPSGVVSPLATSAVTSTSTSQREAVVLIANLVQGTPVERGLYSFIQFAAASLTTAALSPVYSRVTLVQGSAASLAGFRNALSQATSRAGISKVDAIFVTHGVTSGVLFSDARYQMSQVRDTITNGLSSAQRAKLRMLFSTACYGASQRQGWLDAGFKVVSGSNRIYADSVTSHPAFLSVWAAGGTFSGAVAVANSADPLRLSDNAAKVWLRTFGFPNWADVDSTRVISGSSSLTINS